MCNCIWLFSVFSPSPVPSLLKIRLVSHTPFSILDSVYKPLYRSDLPSCVQSPGRTSYALSFHCAVLFPLHSQARVDVLPGLHRLSGVEAEFWATLWPRSDFTVAADDLNNRREWHKSESTGNLTLPSGVNWTSWGEKHGHSVLHQSQWVWAPLLGAVLWWQNRFEILGTVTRLVMPCLFSFHSCSLGIGYCVSVWSQKWYFGNVQFSHLKVIAA